ncbi:hypothetical protein EJB05_13897, partial [Eragrostis curvula]
MDQSNGEQASKRSKPAAGAGDGGEDRLSALPDDVLLLILRRVGGPAAAGRTSVLSRRWSRLWTLLQDLHFHFLPANRIAAALRAHRVNLRSLVVLELDADAASVAAWLPLAATRLAGDMLIFNTAVGRPNAAAYVDERGMFQLPCLGNATAVGLNLGFLSVALPPAGVFARLAELFLERVRFHGPGDLGDVVSSPRCPSLKKLRVDEARGLVSLAIDSVSLLQLDLWIIHGLQQLSITAPALEGLQLHRCFAPDRPPVVQVSAPRLLSLMWMDPYDQRTVRVIGDWGPVRSLITDVVHVYGQEDSRAHNQHHLIELLRVFRAVRTLIITLDYPQDIGELQYLMEDITRLPRVTFLKLVVLGKGHVFGASSFHVFRLCTGIRKLSLVLRDLEAHECPSGCPCDELANWKTDELSLNCLDEVELINLKGAEYEVTFVKQLFSWATVLQKMQITFANLVSESMASKLRERLLTFSRPEVCVEFRMQTR